VNECRDFFKGIPELSLELLRVLFGLQIPFGFNAIARVRARQKVNKSFIILYIIKWLVESDRSYQHANQSQRIQLQ
jgi:hypothetical protein